MEMDFLELVKQARTCRRFDESRPLSENDLEWLMECARAAPSARNGQELRFMTVSWGNICRELFLLTRWAAAIKDWHGPAEGERPTAFIAILMPERGGELLFYDAGIAAQTIQLAASSRGWGACMIHSFDRQKAAELLTLPQGMKFSLLIGLGVARETRALENAAKGASTAYWRDESQVHHVPKRMLSELIIAKF